MAQHGLPDALTPGLGPGVHGLQLGVGLVQSPDGADPHQLAIPAGLVEREVRIGPGVDVQRVHMLRRGDLAREGQVPVQEGAHVVGVRICHAHDQVHVSSSPKEALRTRSRSVSPAVPVNPAPARRVQRLVNDTGNGPTRSEGRLLALRCLGLPQVAMRTPASRRRALRYRLAAHYARLRPGTTAELASLVLRMSDEIDTRERMLDAALGRAGRAY
jgi:hypothetical protein